jgi:hypothetical protein
LLYCILFGPEPDWPMYWTLLVAIDFPLSLVFVAIGRLLYKVPSPHEILRIESKLLDLHNFLAPLLLLGVGGTCWWFFLPQAIAHTYNALFH